MFRRPLHDQSFSDLPDRVKLNLTFDVRLLDVDHGMARLHTPVTTNDAAVFRFNGTRVELREGDCWYLRLSDPHSVENNGPSDRVHLVIDARVNAWLAARLRISVDNVNRHPAHR